MIGEIAGWQGEIVTVPGGRIPVPYNMKQLLDIDSERIRMELGLTESLSQKVAIKRTIAGERANPLRPSSGIGDLDYEAEDSLLKEIGLAPHRKD